MLVLYTHHPDSSTSMAVARLAGIAAWGGASPIAGEKKGANCHFLTCDPASQAAQISVYVSPMSLTCDDMKIGPSAGTAGKPFSFSQFMGILRILHVHSFQWSIPPALD